MSVITLGSVLASPSLPSLPRVALQVLELTRDPEVAIEEIAEVVQYDQALCAKILKTVNSPFFGLTQPCPTIERSITYLGINAVKSLVLGFSLVDLTTSTRSGLDLCEYWRRSVYAASAARPIAVASGQCDPEEAFTAALMQDIGMLAIDTAAGSLYQSILADAGGDHRHLPTAERKAMGFTHADAGAGLGRRWKLPAQIVEPILRHHQRSAHNGAAHAGLVNAVSLSNRIASVVAFDGGAAELKSAVTAGRDLLGLSPVQMKSLVRKAAEDARSLSDFLTVSIGDDVDIEEVLAQADEVREEHSLRVERETDELRAANETLAREADTDALTGLSNRGRFDRDLADHFQDPSGRSSVALVLADGDHFKDVNDTYGHEAGDIVLAALAERLRDGVRDHGTVYRYGGEEFAILLPGRDGRAAGAIAEGIRRRVERDPIEVPGAGGGTNAVRVTISAGVAALEPATAAVIGSPPLLIRAADRAVYAAKDAGRNTVRVFTPRQAA